jgi:hypothetical protein
MLASLIVLRSYILNTRGTVIQGCPSVLVYFPDIFIAPMRLIDCKCRYYPRLERL